MTNLTQFTFIRFLSVIKTNIATEQFLQQLPDAGFKLFNEGSQQNGILLICRDILFNRNDVKGKNINELSSREYRALEQIFKQYQISAECLSTIVMESGLFNIPTKDVVFNGRTVCLEVYPEIEAYVE